MDPINLILTALTTGAVAALQDTVGSAIKDTYQALVSLVKEKFDKKPKAEAALLGYTEDPDTWKKPLEKTLQESGAHEDLEILTTAQKLLELIQSSSSSLKYDVKIDGNVQGFVQGDNARVKMDFNKPERKSKKNSR